MNKLHLVYYTISFLKAIQIYYRIFYSVKKNIFKTKFEYKYKKSIYPLLWNNIIYNNNSYTKKNNKFEFLNLSFTFFENINWNFNVYGKLWTYNLNYFDFLNQKNIDKNTGISIIKNFIDNKDSLLDGKEPYPISIRGFNWVKFLSNNNINDTSINNVLYSHFYILSKNFEYQLLGNHLLENAFSLLFGAYFFRDETFYKKSYKVLKNELNEQILNDGAHFELSPMYHQIILYRLLDCIHLIRLNSKWKNNDLLSILEKKASLMLSWLQNITYRNGNIPMFNDSTYNVAPNSTQLLSYANKLDLSIKNISFSDSGYRKILSNNIEILLDLSDVIAQYQPGHSHSDTFNFEFTYKNKPIIVDTGISTYEKNSRRQIERSSESHNTIRLDYRDSSEIWGGFRVARRAKVISLKENLYKIEATHDGYKNLGALHTRSFIKLANKFLVKDVIKSNKTHLAESYLHFHPDCNISVSGNTIMIDSEIIINLINHTNLIVQEYNFPIGYNLIKKASKIRTLVESESKIEINYEN